jgi:hypothetical protein
VARLLLLVSGCVLLLTLSLFAVAALRLPAVITALGAGALLTLGWFWVDRPRERREFRSLRRRRGLCVSCGYDLAGNVSGTCPECGAAKA